VVTAEARKYIALPWAHGHVLAVRGVVGATLGTDIPQKTFRMGGPYGDSPYVSLPDRYYGLRGYPTSFRRGNHLYLGSLEYRLPLFLIERGPWTVPVFFRSVALTVFVEAGQTFDTGDYAAYGGSAAGFVDFWSNTSVSFGAELIGEVRLAWAGSFQGRVGYGFGIGQGAYPAGIIYAQIGSSF
jgi:outer membrane protein assembly factor BamA